MCCLAHHPVSPGFTDCSPPSACRTLMSLSEAFLESSQGGLAILEHREVSTVPDSLASGYLTLQHLKATSQCDSEHWGLGQELQEAASRGGSLSGGQEPLQPTGVLNVLSCCCRPPAAK